MPKLSYKDAVHIYRTTEDSDGSQFWSLIEQYAAMRITAMDAYSAAGEAAVYNFTPTHRGRCSYNENIDVAGSDQRLLVRVKDGKQFMVLGWREGQAQRGGNPEMILSLTVQRRQIYNLRDT